MILKEALDIIFSEQNRFGMNLSAIDITELSQLKATQICTLKYPDYHETLKNDNLEKYLDYHLEVIVSNRSNHANLSTAFVDKDPKSKKNTVYEILCNTRAIANVDMKEISEKVLHDFGDTTWFITEDGTNYIIQIFSESQKICECKVKMKGDN